MSKPGRMVAGDSSIEKVEESADPQPGPSSSKKAKCEGRGKSKVEKLYF